MSGKEDGVRKRTLQESGKLNELVG